MSEMTRNTLIAEGAPDGVVYLFDESGVSYLSKGSQQEVCDYIATLRERLAAVEAERDALREQLTHQSYTLTSEHQRAEAILAALRAPSEAVVKAAVLHYSGDLQDAIRAAVAAAEKPQ